MYTRPRPTTGYPNGRNQNSPNVGYPIQNAYQQGGFPSPQQGNYKPGNAPNAPSLRPPQMQPSQLMQPRSMQMKSQQPYQQQQPSQQQMKPQQQQQPPPTNPPQPPRLKPILKQPSTSQHQPTPANVQNTPPATQPATQTQTPIPTPVPPPQIQGPQPTQGTQGNQAPQGPQGSQAPQIAQGSQGNQGNLENPGNPGNPGNQGGQGGQATQDPNSCPLKPEIMDVDLEDLPKWRRKAGPKNAATTKINKKLKRLRLNQRLRRTLQPKNAIMVLNEMKAGVQFTFPENQGSMPNSLYVVHAELGGKTYVGQGLSKPLARQSAAENALKALLLEKMTAATVKARMDAESESQSGDIGDTLSLQNNSSEDGSVMDCDDSNEIPWSSLASFALYKLFLEWHNQGTSVPVPRPGLSTIAKGIKRETASPQKNPAQKELPPNPTSIHPVMLLNQMRSGLTYVEINRVGNPPNTMFTLGVEIDGVEYTGAAKNKKDAKKVAAKAALCALYGLTYPEDNKPVLQDQVQHSEVQML